MTSATARAKAKTVKTAPKKEQTPHEFYATQNMTRHCIELTQATLMAAGGEYRELTEKERGLIAEAAELHLVPSATIMLANVLCSRSGKGARQTVSELIHSEVKGPEVEDVVDSNVAKSKSKHENAAFNALIATMTDAYSKHGLVEVLQVAAAAAEFVNDVSLDLSAKGEEDLEIHRESAAVGLVQYLKDLRKEMAKAS
jgi:hypothetical protein